MAILRSTRRILLVDDLVASLRRLADAVVRARLAAPGQERPQQLSTGWFITPHLVVLPGFVFQDESGSGLARRDQVLGASDNGWSAVASEAPEILGKGVLNGAGGVPADVSAVALLRIGEAAPERVLPLSFDEQREGDSVTLIQFPRGDPDPCASFGQVHSVAGSVINYDADTEPGSSGAPVLDGAWRVLAMHIGTDFKRKLNFGLSRAALLEVLQASRWWAEIASYHKLANVGAARAVLQESAPPPAPPGPELVRLRAAISASIAPESLSPQERDTLRELVIDPQAPRWVLRPPERRRVIAAAGSLDALRQVPGREPRPNADPLQRVLDAILDGPPNAIDGASEEELGWWIQAVRWFEPIAKELPKPAQIAHELERRRVRSRLERIAGSEFRGRATDLGKLQQWYRGQSGPLILTGIGGMGKSALLACFASKLPSDTLLLWLDFDRPDLAPDDAVSVLAAIADQANVQLSGFEKPTLDKKSWENDARLLGERIAAKLAPDRPTLLVLDSFEAAQYAERYQELWPVLEQLVKTLPDLRVCVTGRATVPGLTLGGKTAEIRELIGLEEKDARAWLAGKGVTDPAVLEQVVRIARGIPLILRLAQRLVEAGGKVEDLPRDMPQHLIAGYLYDRILDRVQNPDFKPLARGLLVLRRLSVDMVEPVLGNVVDLPAGEPSSWFGELSREMGLVDGSDVLVPRPEVRSATLWLLERDCADDVRTVDSNAADWYAANGAEAPEDAAELVYHRLRLADITGAAQAWRDGCGAFLTYASDDIRDAAAQSWLKQRLGGGTPEAPRPLSGWEQEAAERIRSARARKLDTAGAILRERTERSAHSPLLFHDAYELRARREASAARALLDGAPPAVGSVERDRVALRALLAWEAHDRRAADALLARIADPGQWSDRHTGHVDALAILASRINVTFDLEREIALIDRAGPEIERIQRVLAPVDVLAPRLKERLRAVTSFERSPDFVLIAPDADTTRLLDSIERERISSLPEEPASLRDRRRLLIEEWSRSKAWETTPPAPGDFHLDVADTMVPNVAELGWRRWWLAAHTPFLRGALQIAMPDGATASPLTPAILGTLALFAVREGGVWLGGHRMPLRDAVKASMLGRGSIHVRNDAWEPLKQALRATVDWKTDWDRYIRSQQDEHLVFWGSELLDFREADLTPESSDPGLFLLFLFAPDPLRKLVEDLAGVAPPPELA
jgi:hypothetical protein